MKTSTLILSGLFFIILASMCNATCEDPLIAYHSCLNGCPDAVENPLASAKCDNVCIGQHQKDTDAYYKCQEQERAQKELERKQAEAKLAEAKKLEAERQLQEKLKNTTHVSNVLGSVSITHKDGKVDYRTGKNTVLKDGDTVKTSKGSLAEIQLPDGHTVKLCPNSEFTYQEKAKPKEDLVLGTNEVTYELLLIDGRFHIFCNQYKKKFEVRTSGGAGAIRGTEFIVEYNSTENITKFYLIEGIVDVNDTKNNMYTMKIWETVTLDSTGFKEITSLSQANWDGLVSSIENGTEFTPLPEAQIPLPDNLNPVKQAVGNAVPKKWMTLIIPIAAIILLIILVRTVVRIRRHAKR